MPLQGGEGLSWKRGQNEQLEEERIQRTELPMHFPPLRPPSTTASRATEPGNKWLLRQGTFRPHTMARTEERALGWEQTPGLPPGFASNGMWPSTNEFPSL